MTKWKVPAKKNRLTDKQFDQLLRLCTKTKNALENLFMVLVLGVLGLREGELAHLKESWIDFDREEQTIPVHEPCSCTYCTNKIKKKLKREVTPEEVKKEYWHPKSKNGARTIYFGYHPEIKEVLKEMMDKYHGCPYSPIAISHRITRLGELINLKTYPQALRSTAATRFSHHGISSGSLKSVMGWKHIDMAEHYIASSGVMARKELKKIYGKNQNSRLSAMDIRTFYLTNLGRKLVNRKPLKGEEEWFSRFRRKP